ncbi:metallophosphoesterase family protein [Salinirubrum litoreum]|uniref:Phosphoesterase n=1 Tax=Salinirubrum litoreum TaxID=1126234 RepID=A0ABD5RCQ3_9EURY|nr:metallophosphoesterase family protein [Salinirubrum litoreum]
MQLAVVADTHVPNRAPETPRWVRRRVAAADHTIHAGDFDSRVELNRFRDWTDGHLTAVRGNIDPPDVDLPRVATFDVPETDWRIVVTHGHRRDRDESHDYAERVTGIVAANATGPPSRTVGVAGHTHRLRDARVNGYRLLNPGSATETRPMGGGSMLEVTVDEGGVTVTAYHDDEVIEVDEI